MFSTIKNKKFSVQNVLFALVQGTIQPESDGTLPDFERMSLCHENVSRQS